MAAQWGGSKASSSSSAPGCFAALQSKCGGCFPDQGSLKAAKLTQAEFEELIGFLGAVPILRKHLPRAQLPKIAHGFKLREWTAGTTVIEKGQIGTAFFIVKSGRAQVLPSENGDGPVLYALDYFGGHTITEKRPNVATVVAKGPQPLVTLSISRQDFAALGLTEYLKFPRRPAIHGGMRPDAMNCQSSKSQRVTWERDATPLSISELEFICKVVRTNPNLKQALGDVEDSNIKDVARAAERRKMKANVSLATPGELLADFYIVAEGSFDILSGSASEHRSAEETVTNLTMTQKRMKLKEQFVEKLEFSARGVRCKDGRAVSVHVDRPGESSRSPANVRHRAMSVAGRNNVSEPSDISPFKVGDNVSRVVFDQALIQEVGKVRRVVAVGRSGSVEVEFEGLGTPEVVLVSKLRPAKNLAPVAKLTRGMAYGDLSLLYNTRLTTTCRASEDAVVYAISRSVFQENLSQKSARLEEHYTLLDEVHLLSPLVRSERWEIARSAAGVVHFKAGERIYQQGEEVLEVRLYVVKAGSVSLKKDNVEIAKLRYAGYFGERMLLRNENVPEFSVDAGPKGVTCLAIHAETLRTFVQPNGESDVSPTNEDPFGTPGMRSNDVLEYFKHMPKGRTAEEDLPFSALETLSLLGEGGFGSVFLVRAQETGREYALKRLSKGYVILSKATRQVCLERDILTLVDSDFIIKLFRTYKDKEYVYMLLELCSGGHLYQLLADSKAAGVVLPLASVMFYTASVSIALGHLHERHIAYRDLKAENVLLDIKGNAKLCDMGFAKFVVDKTTTLLGTPEYMAPEMIDPPHAHDHMVDWWALGVLTFELLTGQDPWYDCGLDGDDPMAQLLALRDSHDEGIPERLIPKQHGAAKDFIKRLLCTNPRRRLGFRQDAIEVQKDAWFASWHFNFAALLAGSMAAPEVESLIRRDSQDEPLRKATTQAELETDESLFQPAPPDCSDWDTAF